MDYNIAFMLVKSFSPTMVTSCFGSKRQCVSFFSYSKKTYKTQFFPQTCKNTKILDEVFALSFLCLIMYASRHRAFLYRKSFLFADNLNKSGWLIIILQFCARERKFNIAIVFLTSNFEGETLFGSLKKMKEERAIGHSYLSYCFKWLGLELKYF